MTLAALYKLREMKESKLNWYLAGKRVKRELTGEQILTIMKYWMELQEGKLPEELLSNGQVIHS